MADQINSLGYFLGINNVDDHMRMPPLPIRLGAGGFKAAYQLVEAMNVDIDNTYKLSTRPGYEELINGSDIHSLWSNGDKCFFVDGNILYRLQKDFSITAIRSDLTKNSRMSYAPANDRVYYNNGFECGYVKDFTNYSYMTVTREFKLPLPAGKLIAFYKGCLYVSVKNILYVSDPLCDYYDTRTGYRIFASDITMIRAVDDGIYISDSNDTWFLKGNGNEDFVKIHSDMSPAIIYSDVGVDGNSFGEKGVEGNIAIWTSTAGICLGDNAGTVRNLTERRYFMPESGRGAAFIREINNTKHYINSLY
jgi:hypothetical protein